MNRTPVALFFIALLLITRFSWSKPWWRVYFSNPSSASTVYEKTLEGRFIAAVDTARRSFYGAFYDISSMKIAEALIRAKGRGVDVKLISEYDNRDRKALTELRNAGIEIALDNRSGLMHNKFAIIDGKKLWTGSYNLTKNGYRKNNNNVLYLYSSLVSGIYRNEFLEMFSRKSFGAKKGSSHPADIIRRYYVQIEDTPVNVYFSPKDNIERIIVKRIKKSRNSIYFLLYSFTSTGISRAMVSQYKKGVVVQGIIESRNSGRSYCQYQFLKKNGISIKLDENRYAMHHKVVVIDGTTVITGSYNFSRNANNRNDENIIIIKNKGIAGKYLNEFHRLF